jgi:hypothetical protein
MPLRDWGIYWLKSSQEKGCPAAGKLLAIWKEYNK